MIKVLQIISALHRNGTETALMNFYRNIDRQNIQFDFLIFTSQGMDYLEEIKSFGGKVYVVSGRKNGVFQYITGIRTFFKKHSCEYAIVHFNFCYISTIVPYFYAWKYHIPKRISHAHSSSYVGGWYNGALHKIFKHFAALLSTDYLACSDLAGKWFFRNTVGENRYTILPNGIDTTIFSFDIAIRLQSRQQLGLDQELTLGHIGYFTPVKNHRYLIDVFGEIVSRNQSARLLLIGDGGDLKAKISQYVIEKGLNTNVIFLGKRTDISFLLQAMDYFILPSLFEGLPLSLIEAQAAGLKVIASDMVSKEAKVTDNITFLPLSAGADAWADHILSEIPYERKSQNENLDKLGFTIDYSVKKLMEIYK